MTVHDMPVGFVRLVKTGQGCEMVLVIGNRENWGRKLGASAIREGMKLAFFDMRAEKLIAKIHADNARSRKAFQRCGFLLETQTPALQSLAMTSERYLRLLREDPADHTTHIHITEIDKARLKKHARLRRTLGIFELEHEIERAIVVDPLAVASDVVTMNSKAVVQLDDEAMEVALVYPEDADDSGQALGLLRHGHRHPGLQGRRHFAWRLRNRTATSGLKKCCTSPRRLATSTCEFKPFWPPAPIQQAPAAIKNEAKSPAQAFGCAGLPGWLTGEGQRLQHFKNPRSTHAATDAHGHAHALGTTALAFNEGVAREALARHTIGVAQGDGAAVHVQAIGRDAQLVAAVQHLHGKGFVQLPQVDVLHREAQLLQHLGHGKHGADAHFIRLAAGHGKAQEAAQGLEAVLAGVLFADDHAGAGAVRELAGIASRDQAAGQRRAPGR